MSGGQRIYLIVRGRDGYFISARKATPEEGLAQYRFTAEGEAEHDIDFFDGLWLMK